MAKKGRIREKGTGSIVKQGNRFYLKIRTGSKTKSTTLRGKDDKPVTTRKEAEAAAALLRPVLRADQKEEIALHIASAKKLRSQNTLPIEQIWQCYLKQYTRPDSGDSTLESYRKSLKHFTDWLAAEHPTILQAGQVTPDIAGEYFAYIWNDRGVSGKTFNIYRQALRLIFFHIKDASGLEKNPFEYIESKPIDSESRLAFTEEQVRAIFSGFDSGFYYNTEVTRLGPGRKHIRVNTTLQFEPMNKDEMKILMMLCCWTGCRGQDGCLMRWSNVDLGKGMISYIQRKTARKTNNRAVSLPLHPDLASALREALSFRNRNKGREDFILPSVAHRYQQNPDGVQADVRKIIRCATGCATTAESKGAHRVYRANRYSLHSFRHTFVSFCANAGVPLDVVAAIVGHGSSAMTRHYAHISAEAKKNAVKTLPILTIPSENMNLRKILIEKVSGLSDAQIQQLLAKIS